MISFRCALLLALCGERGWVVAQTAVVDTDCDPAPMSSDLMRFRSVTRIHNGRIAKR